MATVYEVLACAGPDLALARCWAHPKRKFDEIADQWPTACAEIGALYAIERRAAPVSRRCRSAGPAAQRHAQRQARSRPILDQIWQWATVQVGLPRSDFGKAVRYMLERARIDPIRGGPAHPPLITTPPNARYAGRRSVMRAVEAAIATPGTITLPEALTASHAA